MADCVNINSKEFKELRRQTNLSDKVLAGKIGVWQDKNGKENYPTKDDIFSTMSMSNRLGIFKKELSYQQTINVKKNVEIYNRNNSTSLFVDFTQLGQADIYNWKISDKSNGQTSMFQSDDMPSSKANPETLETINTAAKQMGIDIQDLADYAKSNPDIDTKGINGLADLIKGAVAIAQGMENVSLTEEIVHIATAILEQTDPKVITELISKIDRFKIYKATFEAYKGKKAYQLADGRPNVRKIKKEAVDKLIVELIVNASQGSTEYPELMEEETRNKVQKWWEMLLDRIRGIYRKTNVDIFNTVANKVKNANVGGTVGDIKTSGIFLQATKENELVNNFYDTVVDIDSRIQLNPAIDDEKRHYTFDGKRVARSVTEKIKGANRMAEREGLDKFLDDQKREWGSEGHRYIEQYITTNLIDKDGYKRDVYLDVPIETKLDKKVSSKIEAFANELIGSYKPGTRFIIERKVVNEKVKGMLASTVDFMAIEPIIKQDGTNDIRVDILDWKFSAINKDREEDIPWYKQKEWKEQMGEYTKILYSYGLKREQVRKARMIPFIANYNFIIANNVKSGLALKSIEIGKLDSLQETTLYLLPVALNTESTGNEKIDQLLAALRTQWDKLYSKPVAELEKSAKNIQLNQLSKAIRHLHLRIDFEPLVNVGDTFLKNAKTFMDSFKDIDYATLTKEEIKKRLGDLIQYKISAEKYASLDDVYLSHVDRTTMSPEDKVILFKLEHISSVTERMIMQIDQLQREYAIQLGVIEGATTEDTKNTILNAEKQIDMMSSSFLEASKLSARIIKLSSNLIMTAKNLVNIEYGRKMDTFTNILIPLEEEAKRQGKKAFDFIGTMEETGLRLIRKIDRKFWDEIAEAKVAKNKQFFLDNMRKEEYDAMAKEAITKGEEAIMNSVFSSDEEKNDKRQQYELKRLRDTFDINRETFNGYDSRQFGYLFNRTMIEEGHYSKEFEQMRKTPAALKVWEFFTELNQRAKEMGYLDKQGSSFFPLIEASIVEKLSQSDDIPGQIQDFFKDLYTTKVNEQQTYAKSDPETGEVKKVIPKYFTRTDKQINQLSTNLGKIGAIWMKSVMDYETAKDLEFTLLTLHSVEKGKGSLIVQNGEVAFEGGLPKVNEKTNRNADLLETIIDDAVFGIRENLNSLGNATLGNVVSKVKTDEEDREQAVVSIKKGLKNADTLVRSLAIGLKPLIGAANYFGYNFQAFINGGTMYKYSEFTKNNAKITINNLTEEEKALLHLILPLNEDLRMEKRRDMAKKQSIKDWINTWTFTDVMMSTNSAPERKLQFANAMSMNENSMVVDGKIVGIRQYLAKQDRIAKYAKDENGKFKMSETERTALEKSFQERVNQLKESSSLLKIVKVDDNGITIPGVSDKELAKYRTKIVEYGRNLNGLMNDDNKAGYRRDTIFSSFMMFKGWIPKQISVRTLDIQKNLELDEWEYGRARAFTKTLIQIANWNIGKMRHIINGTEEGLRMLDEALEIKRQEHFKKTGQILEITNEEFYDLIRTQINNQMKELGLLLGLMSMVITAKAFQPPEDATALEKNRYKWWAKLINKTSDEVSFYYNPLSADSITRGSIIPSLGLLTKVEQLIINLGKESIGYTINDEEMVDKAHPLKYFLNIIPVGAQLQNEALPYIDPELAKEMGIKVSPEARAR
jgi:hypothetical protein